MEYTYIDQDSVMINGQIYKRMKTIDGKYTKADRSSYMRAWRTKQKFIQIKI
jgi:hypothetical protein